jgi:uncharacterized repeat protein (TIGR01451 family)
VVTTVTPQADLEVLLSAAPATPLDSAITYTIAVTNHGPDTATAVRLTNTLPASVANVTFASSQGSCSLAGNRVTCNLLTVTNGGIATVIVTARPTALGTLTNTAVVQAVTPADPAPANNTRSIVTTVTDPYVVLVADGAVLLSENHVPLNGGIDVGETVRLSLQLKSVGVSNTTALIAALRNAGGVMNASGPQDYGTVESGGPSVGRPFTFTAGGTPGGTLTATLDLADGTNNLGSVAFSFILSATTTVSSPGTVPIPDNARAVPYPSAITATDLAGVVDKITVTLSNLSHAYPDDLDILLVGPEGQAILLMSDCGGGNRIENLNLAFDDATAMNLPDSTSILPGAYHPTDYPPSDTFPAPAPAGPYAADFSPFRHTNPNGTWSLFIVDESFGDLGNLNNGWSLTINTVGFINSITVTPPHLGQPVLLDSNRLQFTVEGDAGLTYVIEASNDLNAWSPIGTVTLSGPSAIFEDSNAGGISRRFYRARLGP